jgi:XTP/dITP diphosphohydrolase
MKKEYVLASGNKGKLREISGILEPLGFTVHPQSDWRVPEAEENAATFLENSLIKARQAADHSGLPSIADDSGLVVPALDGRPGIYSARYAGKAAAPKDNMDKLLFELSGKSGADRQAYFYCAMVMVTSVNDPAPLVATGRWFGHILMSPRGSGGFGYDPLFGVSPISNQEQLRSAAELSPSEKGRISHRGQALRELVRLIREQHAGVTG